MLQKEDKSKILFFRESSFAVAELIFNYPSRTFYIRMIEKETGLSTTSISRAIDDLEKHGIINVEDTALTKNIKADINSESYRHFKMIFNIYRLATEGIIGSLNGLFNNPKAIVCFGSYARGEDLEESDIDLLVVANKKAEVNLGCWEKRLKRKINITVMDALEKAPAEFKNAAANGIVLQGYLKIA